MIVPGFSSVRFPMRFRLYLAIAISISLTPIIVLGQSPDFSSSTEIVKAVIAEGSVGFGFGFIIRIYFTALEFIAEYISTAIGLSNIFGFSIDSDNQMPVLGAFISIVSVTMIILADLHHRVIIGLLDTYSVVAIGQLYEINGSFKDMLDRTSIAFFAALKIGGPFVVYTIFVNFSFGLLNKIIPQVPAYFLSVPLLIIGGFYVLYIALPDMLQVFQSALSDAI